MPGRQAATNERQESDKNDNFVAHESQFVSQVSRQRQKFGQVCRKQRIGLISLNKRTRYVLWVTVGVYSASHETQKKTENRLRHSYDTCNEC